MFISIMCPSKFIFLFFQMDSLDRDTVALLSRRAFDVAASTRGVKVYLNGKLLPIKNFKDYVDLCLKVSMLHCFFS